MATKDHDCCGCVDDLQDTVKELEDQIKTAEHDRKAAEEERDSADTRLEELETELEAHEPPTQLLGTYIGDGVYASHDGHALVLTTHNGEKATNRIVIEPEVYAAFTRFVERGGR